MRLLRTDAGEYVNAERIVRLANERGEDAGSWIAVLDDGEAVALAVYYSIPGRIERELPDLMVVSSESMPVVVADCGSNACCCEA
jgi:hypothetical protein